MTYTMPAGLKFDAGPHVYRYMGQPVPSVTQILKGSGDIGGFYRGTAARDRGTAVHEATELMDTIGMPVASFQPELQPYLLAWQEFARHPDVEILAVEVLVYSRAGYAGQADRLIRYRGQPAIVDIKTGAKAKWHRLQLAGYADAVDEQSANPIKTGLVVRLTGDGFQVDTWSDAIAGAEPFLPCRHEWRQALARFKEKL